MVDLPGRSAFEPDDRADPSDGTGAAEEEQAGWGSPVPAEYGSLHALSPPEHNREPGPLTTGLFSAWSRVAPRKAPDADRPEPQVEPAPGREPAPAVGAAAQPVRPAPPDPVVPRERPERPSPTPAAARDIGDLPTASVPVPGAAAGGDPSAASGPVATGALPAPGPAGGDPVTDPGPAMPTLPPRAVPPGRPGRRPGRSRSRVAVRRVDVASVAKLSVLYYLIVLMVIVVAALLLWVAADVFGTLPSIDKSVRTLFSLRKFELHAGAVALYTAAAGVVLAVVGTLANILLALIYNLMADVLGGVRVELESFTRE